MPPWLLGTIVVVSAFILQVSVVPHLRIGQAQPDLVLMVVVTYAFMEGPGLGATAGFCGGLLEDLFSLRFMGLSALTKTIVGYMAGLVERTVFADSRLLPTAAMFIASVVAGYTYLGVMFLMGEGLSISFATRMVVLPTALYNSILTAIFYPWLVKLMTARPRRQAFSPEKVEKLAGDQQTFQ